MKLLNKTTLTVKRKIGKNGHYNQDGDWVSDTNIVTVKIKGNCQPYIKNSVKNGVQEILPNGVTLADTRILFTGAKLITGDDRVWSEADTVEVDNQDYEVFSEFDYHDQLPLTSHSEYLLIRKDKMNGQLHLN
ncbi:hypothetical protein [Cronobacter muytjensii]|uniref:Uncharacterized protein n=1 Tax=Cronobacter muytjensii TaxID=413501 RepID=A0A2T7AWK1_9ENTR|nr:hypothetical protein [Cronobacter muytjensii]KAB0884833.1 hypothetical protein FZI19_03280 [Cronobacter muytjensii]MBF4812173.1 hypothetical protein [Cronobacter muytjensii]PUX16525.1 hypothetical protein AUN14_05690 [Cronobacter muytjensii]